MLNILISTVKYDVILSDFNTNMILGAMEIRIREVALNCIWMNLGKWFNHAIQRNRVHLSISKYMIMQLYHLSSASIWMVGQDISSDHFPVFTTIFHKKTSKDNLPSSNKWKIKLGCYEDLKEETTNIQFSNTSMTDITNIIRADKEHILKIKQRTQQPMNS